MKRIFYKTIILTLLIFSSSAITSSCNNREETVSCFPQLPINVSINLNLPAYRNLWNVGGWIYLNEQVSGNRGLIIVRTGNQTFKIFDRNAPHICPNGNETTLEVKDNIKIICPKDNAEWILITGEPTKIATIPPKTYRNYYYDTTTSILSVRY